MTELLANDGLMAVLVIGVIVLAGVVAWVNQSRSPFVEEDDDPRYHTLRSDYQSGMGGGAMRTWKVPKDPDEYARFFVPKGLATDQSAALTDQSADALEASGTDTKKSGR
ncbi:hypothetical protein [Phaeobacter sp.]|uniref:hypothetical protein n=1 Tax=Phaeobacter sp. TaxID=1902409 RepID=UPI0025D801DE|nr:hypothetical protein [Phaeobacter sp.]